MAVQWPCVLYVEPENGRRNLLSFARTLHWKRSLDGSRSGLFLGCEQQGAFQTPDVNSVYTEVALKFKLGCLLRLMVALPPCSQALHKDNRAGDYNGL